MSKTYNSEYEFRKIAESDEYPYIKATRHPNKRKNSSLGREFSKVGLSNPANWKLRYSEEHYKSSRMHLSKREETAKRRNRLKHEAEEQINRELNNE